MSQRRRKTELLFLFFPLVVTLLELLAEMSFTVDNT
jgi:hypothetical protein